MRLSHENWVAALAAEGFEPSIHCCFSSLSCGVEPKSQVLASRLVVF